MQKFRSDLIEKVMQQRGWSNEKAAAEAGVSNPTIIDLKKGRYEKKTIASVMKVAAALGLSMCDLFNDTQPQPATHEQGFKSSG